MIATFSVPNGTLVVLAFLWLAVAVVRPVAEDEAVGQVKRLARFLVKRAARALPEVEREIFVRDVLAELAGPELRDRPLSQLFLALDLWIHSSDLRLAPRQVLRSAGRKLSSSLVWLGGTHLEALSYVPQERPLAVSRGLSVLNMAAFVGWAAALYVHDWFSLGLPIAALVGISTSLLFGELERNLLLIGISTPRKNLGRLLWPLPFQILLGYAVATAVELDLFRPELQVAVSQHQHHSSPNLLAALQGLSQMQQAHPVPIGGLSLLCIAFVCLPYVGFLLSRLGVLRPIDIVIERLGEKH